MRKSLAFLLAFLFCLSAPVLAQKKKDEPVKKGFVWDNHPSIVFGKDIHVDIRGRVQLDWRHIDPPQKNEEIFDFHSARIGLKGEVTKNFEFEAERVVNCTPQSDPEAGAPCQDFEIGQWKDVYLTWKQYDKFTVQGGRFKMPFGMETMTGSTDLDFAYRALASSTIGPSRDTGGMASGRFYGRDITYQAGFFHHDGDHGELKTPQFTEDGSPAPEPGPSFAARVTGTPLRKLGVPRRLKSLRLGTAYTNAFLPEGLNSTKGKSVLDGKTFFQPVYVKGRRQRYSAELEWTPLNFSLMAEWMQSREDRKEQSNRNQDLSDFLATGWYVTGTWTITGESAGANPKKPLFNGGYGSIEIAARYEELGFTSAEHVGPAFTNPRADNLKPNADRVWTGGVNWKLNRYIQLVGNAIHESFLDPNRTISSGLNSFWTGLFRTQVVF